MDIKLDLCTVLGRMKNILTSLIFSVTCFLANAQQNRFIYLQTENRQSFFVKLDNKILNSNPLGYLIIPKLDDGSYSLVIGFPESSLEQEFNCSIKNKDVGFIIKNAGEKQWQLLNLQTLNVLRPGDIINKPVINYEKETDPFSTMLANAVHDSSILRKDLSKEIIPEKINEQVTKDSVNAITTNNAVTAMSDSNKRDIVIVTLPEKPYKISPKDSTSVVLNKDAVIARNDSILTIDVAKKDIAKETVPEKSNEQTKKDSANTTAGTHEIIINKPDNVQVVQTLPSPKNESKDSVLIAKPNNDVALLKSVIKRKLKKTNKEGLEMMYVDDNGYTKDTIRIFIPSDKKKQDEEKQTETVSLAQPTAQIKTTKNEGAKNKTESKVSGQPKEIVNQTQKESDFSIQPTVQQERTKADGDKNKIESKIPEQLQEKEKQGQKEPVFIKSVMINSDCKNFSTEEDFLKLRKKIVAENNDEDMIRVAKKYFKTKCFTTEQIKNLSVLFLKDEGKYIFFDASYAFVSDSDQYFTLEKQLTDNYYITRFRAMIHK
jgi:hypothetical protein